MLLKHLMKREKVFLIETSKLFINSFFLKKNYFCFSLRELLTVVGNPAERLTDIEVRRRKLSNNELI